MYDDNTRKKITTKKGCGCGCLGIVVIALIVIVCIIVGAVNYYSTKTYTATVTDKYVKNYDDSVYLVSTELEDGSVRVFAVEDTLLKWRWNSSDVYAQIKVGKTYKFEVIGWRIGFFSNYENIINFSEIDP